MKYKVYKTLTIKTIDVIESDKPLKEFKKWINEEQLSLAGEISRLGIKDYHNQVAYQFDETKIEKL